MKTLLLAFLWTRFTPIHKWAQDTIDNSKSLIMSSVAYLLHNDLTSCIKCMAFWIGLIMTGSIYLATISMILAFLYDKCYSTWEKTTKLF